MRWDYDFGDGWRHTIELEAIEAVDQAITYPRCIAGRHPGISTNSGVSEGDLNFHPPPGRQRQQAADPGIWRIQPVPLDEGRPTLPRAPGTNWVPNSPYWTDLSWTDWKTLRTEP